MYPSVQSTPRASEHQLKACEAEIGREQHMFRVGDPVSHTRLFGRHSSDTLRSRIFFSRYVVRSIRRDDDC
jgi:hypothetical protein